MMLEAIIIDDEEGARFLLRDLLENNFTDQLAIKGEADGVETGIAAIQKLKPNLVFLDIKMQDGTGFDLLDRIENLSFEVIFVTAYDEFAIKAFEFSAFGYILKPIKKANLISTIENLRKRQDQNITEKDQQLKVLVENYANNDKVKKLVVTKVKGFEVVDIDTIIRLEGDGNYTNIVTTEKAKITSSKNLKQFEDLLLEMGFFRIHLSTIVNLRYVKGYSNKKGGQVQLIDGSTAKLSRYRKEAFLSRFY